MASGDNTSLAVSDLGFLDFYWLLRPGEYCSSTESHRFRLCDVLLFIGGVRLYPLTCDIGNLDRVTFVTLTFITQKSSATTATAAPGISSRAPSSRQRIVYAIYAPTLHQL